MSAFISLPVPFAPSARQNLRNVLVALQAAVISHLVFLSLQCQIRFGGRKEIATDSDSR